MSLKEISDFRSVVSLIMKGQGVREEFQKERERGLTYLEGECFVLVEFDEEDGGFVVETHVLCLGVKSSAFEASN